LKHNIYLTDKTTIRRDAARLPINNICVAFRSPENLLKRIHYIAIIARDATPCSCSYCHEGNGFYGVTLVAKT